MKILVSSCLLGENCKYSGGNNKSEKLLKYLKDYDIVSVCPEILGGLGIPRNPNEIVNGRVLDEEGNDVTKQFREGAEKTLIIAKKYDCKKAILKSKSPSCGCGEIYDGNFNHTVIKGNGVSAQLLLDNGIEILNENSEEIIGKLK